MEDNKPFWISFQKAFSEGLSVKESIIFAFIKVMYIPERICYYICSNNSDLETSIMQEFHTYFITMFGEQSEHIFKEILKENKLNSAYK